MATAAGAASEGLEALLEHLKRTRGFDFTGYKRSSLERRIRKRMAAVGVPEYEEYVDFLEVHPEEFESLFNTILINVTSFFRDPDAWGLLAADVLPRVIQSRPAGAPLRVWCAGCSSGEESYTVAMLLAEALGEPDYLRRVKIYATDVDAEALATARQGAYGAEDVEPVPPELRERYFERSGQRHVLRRELRRTVIFGRNDLVQDAPISRVDLLLCRNTLMYFNAESQARILRRFHFALGPGGFLFLGKSEMLLTHADLFSPLDMKARVFTRLDRPTLRDRLVGAGSDGGEADGAAVRDGSDSTALRDHAFDGAPLALLVVERDGSLLQANHSARSLLGLEADDAGRPVRELAIAHRPVDLWPAVREAIERGRGATLAGDPFVSPSGQRGQLEVHVMPVRSGDEVVGASVAYVDVTREREAQEALERSRLELTAAYEELQSTVEELETTNEELQSTNEELETTNEELQSTNEELETMNEELQSTNEELETINDELRTRTLEMNEANALMDGILTSLGMGVMVVDREQMVRVWNRHSEDMWGLRDDEAQGTHVLNLDIGLPVDSLRAPIREALSGANDRTRLRLEATDRRGRPLICDVTVLSMSVGKQQPLGALVLMERGGPGSG